MAYLGGFLRSRKPILVSYRQTHSRETHPDGAPRAPRAPRPPPRRQAASAGGWAGALAPAVPDNRLQPSGQTPEGQGRGEGAQAHRRARTGQRGGGGGGGEALAARPSREGPKPLTAPVGAAAPVTAVRLLAHRSAASTWARHGRRHLPHGPPSTVSRPGPRAANLRSVSKGSGQASGAGGFRGGPRARRGA